jgi:hypothetical protein
MTYLSCLAEPSACRHIEPFTKFRINFAKYLPVDSGWSC